jgi:SARP family transcriptional regulator, regulator of embCAB operon
MKCRVLGPLSIEEDGVRCTPTAPKLRQMLALLLLSPGHVASIGKLIDELWEYRPPARPVDAIYTYIMQLRKALRPRAGGERIGTTPQGYQLAVRAGELDLDLFGERVEKARVALSAGDDETAAQLLRRVLASWSGPALVDVPTGPILSDAIAVLDQRRLDAVILRTWAELNLGRHLYLIGELSALAYHHRTNEELAAQLMIALSRSGRQADALDAFHRLRAALAEDLGASPSRPMHQLYTDVISADPKLHRSPVTESRLSLDLVYAATS